ncbi:MAG TPA: haloacid dehalogenase-like hydrolase [Anaerolineales bacterium]|nr:haloacid dehalogenase-like hydrolase [Anaerolineales bacterium]
MIVISDMMGTLTTGSPFLGLVDWVRHNQSKWQARFYTAKAMPAYVLAKNGLIDWQEWGQQLMIESLAYIKNADEAKLQRAAEWAVEHNLWKRRREDVIARLIKHREDGARVYIASSSVEPFVRSFASRFGADTISTPVKIVDGQVKLAGELVASENKIGQVLSQLGVERVGFAYGDTEQDIPLLEHADHPVAVYPDKNLKKVALERGWEIIGDTPKYG